MPITALFFLLIFSLGCMVTLKRPYVGLLLYFFVYYMHPPGKYWGSAIPELRWTLIVALLTLISTLMHEKDLKAWLKPKASKLLITLFIYVCLQMLWVSYPALQQQYLILLFKLVILYFLIVTLVNTEERLVGVIIINCIGAAYIGLNAMQTHTRGRFEDAGLPGIEDGNLLAIHLVPIIILSSVIVLSSAKYRYLIFIPLAFVANVFFMAGSRGGILGLLCAGLFFIWFSPSEKKKQVLKWSMVAILMGSMLVGPLIIERVNQVLNPVEDAKIDKSAESRFVIIQAQWEMFKEHALLGFGHRGTLIQSPYFIPQEYMTKTKAGGRRASHNITMTFLVDHGFIGSLIFLMLILTSVSRVKLIKQNEHASMTLKLVLLSATSGLIGVMASSQFSNSKVLEISIWLIAIVASCCLILNKIDHSKETKS